MSDGNGNDTKTREQLLAEIATLKAALEQRDAGGAEPASVRSASPVFSTPITRRASLVSWVAPVILALPVVQAVGMVLKPGTAYAAATKRPTVAPTVAPTFAPTIAGRCVVSPTAAPPTGAP